MRAVAVPRDLRVGEVPHPGRPVAELPADQIDVPLFAVTDRFDQAVVAELSQPPQAMTAADQRAEDTISCESRDRIVFLISCATFRPARTCQSKEN
jgi:hypothetical protein